MRVGIGYDVHPLVEGRRLVLGGLEVPFERGLDGHSDADVVTHSIIDALLGAASLGDIGVHFPSTEAEYENISSILLLCQVGELLRSHHWQVGNIDVTIVAERPKLAPWMDLMRQELSQALQINREQIGLKATTAKGLDSLGQEQAIAAYAVALLRKTGETP